MAAKDEDGGNEGMLGGLREMAQLLKEMISQVLDQGGENKRNSDETSDESNHQLAGLCTTYNVLLADKKSDQVGDSDAIRVQFGDSDLASKYNLPDDEEVTNPTDYTSSDYDAIRDQLQEHFSSLSIENDDDSEELAYDASLKQYMSKIDSSSSDHLEAEQAQYGTHEHASDSTFDVRQPVNPAQAPPKPRLQRQNAMQRQRHTRELDPGYSASSLRQYMSKIDSSSSSDHLEAEQAQYGTHEHASDFTFDVKQPVNPEKAPPKPRLQRQNAMQRQRYTREQPVTPAQAPPKPRLQRQNAMRRQRQTSELDPGYSASYLNQPMPTTVTAKRQLE